MTLCYYHYSLLSLMYTYNFLSSPILRQPLQLSNLSKVKNGLKLFIFTHIELYFGLVVAENHLQHTFLITKGSISLSCAVLWLGFCEGVSKMCGNVCRGSVSFCKSYGVCVVAWSLTRLEAVCNTAIVFDKLL